MNSNKRNRYCCAIALAALILVAWLETPRVVRAYWLRRLERSLTVDEEKVVFSRLRTRVHSFQILDAHGKSMNYEDALGRAQDAKYIEIIFSDGFFVQRPLLDVRNAANLRNR